MLNKIVLVCVLVCFVASYATAETISDSTGNHGEIVAEDDGGTLLEFSENFEKASERSNIFKRFWNAPISFEIGGMFVSNNYSHAVALIMRKQFGRFSLQVGVIDDQHENTCDRLDCAWFAKWKGMVGFQYALFETRWFRLETGIYYVTETDRVSSYNWIIMSTFSVLFHNDWWLVPDEATVRHGSNAGFGPKKRVCQAFHIKNNLWCPTGKMNLGEDFLGLVWLVPSKTRKPLFTLVKGRVVGRKAG